MLESAAPTTGARIVRNPGYWASGEPHLDAVQIDFNVEPQLAILKIQKSQQDMMLEPVPAAQVLQLQNDPQAKGMFKEGPQDDCQWISLPTQLKPFDDVRVRKAVAMAVDKEKLVKVVKGLGQPANGTFFSPLSPYFEDGVAYAYDPEQAKALLSEAGLSGGFTAPFWYQDQPPYADMGPAIVEDLAQVGIKLDAKPMVYDQFVQKTNAGPPAMIIFAWEDAYRHGAYIVDSAFTSAAIEAGCCNYPKYSSMELNALAADGHSEDLTKSADAYRQIGRIVVAQEVLWVPLLYPRRADLVNTQVQGFNVARYPSGQARPFERYSLS
jgi:ABC-type transport system substrate-binding protein